jgi:NADH-quinone oxidoreductase subunit N
VEAITDLAGLSRSNPFLAITLTIFVFSMAGIPPLAGFFSKLYIFKSAIDQGFVWLSVIGVLSSVVSAYYYIRIVKIVWFDDAVDSFDAVTPANSLVLWGTGAVTLLYVFLPAPLIASAEVAAKALLSGG